VVGIFKANRGMIDAKLYREVGSNVYLIYSEWESMDAFADFTRSDDFKRVTALGREIIEGTPRHRVYTEINMGGR
jgi:heme-degrading monooxygenase HmoA